MGLDAWFRVLRAFRFKKPKPRSPTGFVHSMPYTQTLRHSVEVSASF